MISRLILPIFAAFVVAVSIGYVASPLSPWPAAAANITVNTLLDVDAVDGVCSLREAIIAANTNAAYKECAAGTGADAISFSVSGSIMLTADLPSTTDASVLTVNGAGAITLNGAGSFAAFNVVLPGVLTLQGLTITNTLSGVGGAILNNAGTVTVNNSTISENTATVRGASGTTAH